MTRFEDFERLVQERSDVWVVHFGTQARVPSWWSTVADKLKNVVRVGYVHCSDLSSVNKDSLNKIGFAEGSCAKAVNKPAIPQVLGYTFSGEGDFVVATQQYPKSAGGQSAGKVTSWALDTLLPSSLVEQLTAHAGTNVLHEEELGAFLRRRSVAKAIFFTTSQNGKPPALVTSLAVFFRQRLLIGEVKASDMTLRKAFGAKEPPEVVVTDKNGKRHKLSEFSASVEGEPPTGKKGAKGSKFSRARVSAFLEQFANNEEEMSSEVHKREGVSAEHVKVKRQAYSDAESEQSYPHKRFNPWTTLQMKQGRKAPAADELKKAYKEMAKRWHPDKCKAEDRKKCEGKMSEATLANQILGDTSGRRLQQWEAWRLDMVSGRKDL